MEKQKVTDIHPVYNHSNYISKIVIPIFLGLLIFCAIIIGAFFVYREYYKEKIYPGIYVANFDLGGMNKTDALSVVGQRVKKLNEIGLTLKNNIDESSKEVKYQELGVKFDKDETINNALAYGKNGSYYEEAKAIITALIDNVDILLVINFDDQQLKNAIKELSLENSDETVDATFIINDKDEFEIVKEKDGTSVDYNQIKTEIYNCANSQNIYKTISIGTKVKQANITNSDIASLTDAIKQIIDKKIVYSYGQTYYQPTKKDLSSWVVIEKHSDPKVTLSDEEIQKYITQLAQKIDVKVINKQVNSDDGNVVTEGQDGKILNQEKAFSDTKKALENNTNQIYIVLDVKTVNRAEEKITVANNNTGGTPGLADGKYIEVNLATQTMYLFDGKNQIANYTVSTGAWDTPTPIGVRTIQGKSARAWSEKYGLYMPYWNSLGDGYGIHELPEWPGGYKEGESHLGTPVSHGCIRLGVGAAQMVYDWAPIGTQVFIHE